MVKRHLKVPLVYSGKNIFLLTVIFQLLWVYSVSGQQQFRFSEYFMVGNSLNPAMAGSTKYLDIKTGYRQQWSGLAEAPETYFISIHGNLNRNKTKNFNDNAIRISDPDLLKKLAEEKDISLQRSVSHGLGAYVAKDVQGAFTRQEANFSYATHFYLGGSSSLAIGVGGTMRKTELDFGKIEVANPDNDDLYNQYLQNNGMETVLRINSGIHYYSKNLFFGYAADNLYNQIIDGFGTEPAQNTGIEHYILSGVKLNLSENFSLIPGFLVRYAATNPLSVDVNLKAGFADIGWIGASYRHEDAVIGMLGIKIADPIVLSYAYDYTYSGLGNFNQGSHELIMGFRLFNNSDDVGLLW